MSRHVFRFLGEMKGQGIWSLEESESLHLRKVLRLSPGDALEVTDGRGNWCAGRVGEFIGSKSVAVYADKEYSDPLPKSMVTLALGALKPKTFDDLLPALVELGTNKIVVFRSGQGDRSRIDEKVQGRWRRIAIESLKQCKRSRLPQIEAFDSLVECLNHELTSDADNSEIQRVMLAPGSKLSLQEASLTNGGFFCVVGSEAGLTKDDLELLQKWRFQSYSIGDGVLRAETAAVVAAAILTMKRPN